MKNRTELDSIGSLEVPADAYYGVQSLRAMENFRISGRRLHPRFIESLAVIKKAAALTNYRAGLLEERRAKAIMKACDEVIAGKYADQFIVDAIQGGAGTSANMNVNEVIANRAIELMRGEKGDYSLVHPNDHVNMAQSTNDVIPSAGKITVLKLMPNLIRELEHLEKALLDKAKAFDHILKMGRTQLQDAVPMRLGQTFHAYAGVVARDTGRLKKAAHEMCILNMGGTAIGTAINVSPEYLRHIVENLADMTSMPLKQAEDLIDATQNLDGFVAVSAALKTCAVDPSQTTLTPWQVFSFAMLDLSKRNLWDCTY